MEEAKEFLNWLEEMAENFEKVNKEMEKKAEDNTYQQGLKLCKALHGLYMAAQDSGFNEDQAFQIVIAVAGAKA